VGVTSRGVCRDGKDVNLLFLGHPCLSACGLARRRRSCYGRDGKVVLLNESACFPTRLSIIYHLSVCLQAGLLLPPAGSRPLSVYQYARHQPRGIKEPAAAAAPDLRGTSNCARGDVEARSCCAIGGCCAGSSGGPSLWTTRRAAWWGLHLREALRPHNDPHRSVCFPVRLLLPV
jgi:hypothetical protein